MMKKRTDSKNIVELLEKGHRYTLDKTYQMDEILTNLRYEGKASFGKNLKQADALMHFFNKELTEHVKLEEEVVFPFLERHLPKLESVIHLLKAEHEDFRRNLRSFQFSFGELSREKRIERIEKIKELGTYLIYLLRNHIQAETESVYKVVDRELHSDEKRELAGKIREKSPRGGV